MGDLDEEQSAFLQDITDEARALTGGQAAALCLLDGSATRIQVAAGSGGFAGQVGDQTSAGSGLPGRVLAMPHPVTCLSCDAACCPFAPPWEHRHLLVPIEAGNRVRGVLCATSETRTGTRQNWEPMLVRLAGMAGSCLADERVCHLAEGLGALTERQRIAADMHDSVAQSLAALHMQVDSVLSVLSGNDDPLPQLLRVRGAITDTIGELRAVIQSMRDPRDPMDKHEGLADVLAGAARDAGMTAGVIAIRDGRDFLVPRPVAAEVRRIVSEALTNADRHAHASSITVRLSRQGRQAIVRVTDNGIGFTDDKDPDAISAGEAVSSTGDRGSGDRATAAPPARVAHFGVDVMRLRAAGIGGRLEIRSAPGRGTEVVLRWPECAA